MIGSRRPAPPVEALEMLRQRGVLVDARDGSADRERAVTVAMMAVIRQEKLRRQRRRRVVTTILFAALVLLAVSVGFVLRTGRRPAEVATRGGTAISPAAAELEVTAGSVVATSGPESKTVPSGGHARVAEGDDIRTAGDGSAVLSMPRGVRIELSAATTTHVEHARETEQRILLDLGKTFVSVPKPGGPSTVEVVTPNAKVVVHGTEFTVLVERSEPNGAIVTTVSVSRGSVLVLDEAGQRFVSAGSSWSSAPPAVIETRPAASGEPASVDAPRARRGNPRSGTGVLGAQNRVFQMALDARKAGDDVAMVRYLDEFLQRFPGSALEPEVRLARLRALSRLGRTNDAASEARRYLSENPDEATRDEARRAILEAIKPQPSPRNSQP